MLRKLSKLELTKIKREFNKWGVFEFFSDRVLLIKDNDYNGNNNDIRGKNEIYFLSNDLQKIISNIPDPYNAGLSIGILKKTFFPSMPFLFIVTKHSKNFPNIVINEKAENLVLYGRDIIGGSILSTSNFTENALIIILNNKREPIGLGRAKFSSDHIIQYNKITVENLYDLGFYLREENTEEEF